jgi:hypothetical protein
MQCGSEWGKAPIYTERMSTYPRFLFILPAILACSCCHRQVSTVVPASDIPTIIRNTQQAAAQVDTRADSIGTHVASIERQAPRLTGDTQPIREATAELKAVAGQLRQASTDLTGESNRSKEVEERLAAVTAENQRLTDEQDGLLSRLLTIAAIGGLGLAVVGGIWLRSLDAVLFGAGLFCTAVAAKWILAYRAVIAMVVIGCTVVALVWKLVRERGTVRQLVSTVEAAKPLPVEFVAAANTLQSKRTRQVVDSIQRRLGSKAPVTSGYSNQQQTTMAMGAD